MSEISEPLTFEQASARIEEMSSRGLGMLDKLCGSVRRDLTVMEAHCEAQRALIESLSARVVALEKLAGVRKTTVRKRVTKPQLQPKAQPAMEKIINKHRKQAQPPPSPPKRSPRNSGA